VLTRGTIGRVLPGQAEGAPVTITLAVANQKGGVAKTTTVASLGAALVEMDQRVLVVDLDPQACLTFSLGLDPDALELSVHDVLLGRVPAAMALQETDDGMTLLPAAIDLTGSEARLVTRGGREFVLREALSDVASGYDWVIVDCSPSLGVLTLNALTAADAVVIPLQCETLSHRGVGQLLETIDEVRKRTNPELDVLGILPTLFDGRTTHARAVLADVAQRYSVPVLEPPVPKSVRFAEAPAAGRTVLRTAPSSPGAQAYREHARRLLAAVDGGGTAADSAGAAPPDGSPSAP
jgi:chromosome partitioning protein